MNSENIVKHKLIKASNIAKVVRLTSTPIKESVGNDFNEDISSMSTTNQLDKIISKNNCNEDQMSSLVQCSATDLSSIQTDEDKSSLHSKTSSFESSVTEDFYSSPELGQLGYLTEMDYQHAINQCKEKILQLPEDSAKRSDLVKNIVDLRLKLEKLKENESTDENWKKILNHNFIKVSNMSVKYFCDCCSTLIWGILQIRYRCRDCGFNCHSKCLFAVRRKCVAETAKFLTNMQLKICPEMGLSRQQYSCAECKNSISITGGDEARLCDYTGLYYCSNCHWNNLHPSPARILHNWDHTPQKMCQHSFQLLKTLKRKPILNIQEINPMLFNFVEDLAIIQKMREDILQMKPYLVSCNSALQNKLLRKLGKRQHFVDSANMYTIADLKDIHSGLMITELRSIHDHFTHHIKSDCSLCQAKGFVCEVCNSNDTLFPFDPMVSSCPRCLAVFHGDCFSCIDTMCPRCKRIHSKRKVASLYTNDCVSSSSSDEEEKSSPVSSFVSDGMKYQQQFLRKQTPPEANAAPEEAFLSLSSHLKVGSFGLKETKKIEQKLLKESEVFPSIKKKNMSVGDRNYILEDGNPFLNEDDKNPFLNEDDKNPFLNKDDKNPFLNEDDKNPFLNEDDKNPFLNKDDKNPFLNGDDKNPFLN